MKGFSLSIAILFMAGSNLQAQEDSSAALQRLTVELEQDFDAGDAAAGLPPGLSAARQMDLAEFKRAVARADKGGIQLALHRLSINVESTGRREECLSLAAILNRELQEDNLKTIADLEKTLRSATNAAVSARTSLELDPTVAQLDTILAKYGVPMGGPFTMPPSLTQFANELIQVQQVRRFVSQWQDGLAQLSAGPMAFGSLKALRMASESAPSFFPRSKILLRINELAAAATAGHAAPSAPTGSTVQDLVAGVRTLEQLGPACEALDKISQDTSDPRRYQAKAAVRCLSALDQGYHQVGAGAVIDITNFVTETSPAANASAYDHLVELGADELVRTLRETMLALRSELLVLALPRVLDLPAVLKGQPGEGPDDFLQRVKTGDLAAGDYVGAALAEQTRVFLRTGDENNTASDEAAAFAAADRLDSARQYVIAVGEYERALACGSNLVPARLIGDRLDAIKAQHPRDFEFGLQMYLAAPAERARISLASLLKLSREEQSAPPATSATTPPNPASP